MKDIRNILLIGRTGSGKSTLANVITGSNEFKESNYAVSETKEIKIKEFEHDGAKYKIIDTVGIGDTRMSLEKDLYALTELSYSLKDDGLSQILLVTRGELSEETKFTYDLLREVIFDENIVEFTTIVKTRFDDFKNESKRNEDKKKLIDEDEKIREITGGRTEKIIHMNNPSIDVVGDEDAERQNNLNKKIREKSKKILLEHLAVVCKKKAYTSENLIDFNKWIGEEKQSTEKKIIREFIKRIKEKKSRLSLSKKELDKLNELYNKITKLSETQNWISPINLESEAKSKGMASKKDYDQRPMVDNQIPADLPNDREEQLIKKRDLEKQIQDLETRPDITQNQWDTAQADLNRTRSERDEALQERDKRPDITREEFTNYQSPEQVTEKERLAREQIKTELDCQISSLEKDKQTLDAKINELQKQLTDKQDELDKVLGKWPISGDLTDEEKREVESFPFATIVWRVDEGYIMIEKNQQKKILDQIKNWRREKLEYFLEVLPKIVGGKGSWYGGWRQHYDFYNSEVKQIVEEQLIELKRSKTEQSQQTAQIFQSPSISGSSIK